VIVVLSSRGGDKNKGKLVDNLAADFDLRARYAESNNAGHPGIIISTMTVLRTPQLPNLNPSPDMSRDLLTFYLKIKVTPKCHFNEASTPW